MIELIYPYEMDLPVIPPLTADCNVAGDGVYEYFPVVESNGIVTGRTTRAYCHSGAKPLHPVIHIHIIDRFARIYLQKRSMKKDIQPGKWDTAVGGHVSFGESFHEAAFREASEELGLMEFNPIHIETYQFESEIEKELVCVFAAVGTYDLKPDLDEVDDGRWWPVGEIDDNLGRGIFTPNFESEFRMIRSSLLSLL